MKVPKEIASKAERYEELKKEIDTLYEELEEFANENGFEDFLDKWVWCISRTKWRRTNRW